MKRPHKEDQQSKINPGFFSLQRHGQRTTADVPCGYCPHIENVALKGRCNPELLKRMMSMRGWLIPKKRGKNTCPKCVAKFRSIKKREQGVVNKKSGGLTIVSSKDEGKNSPADFKIQRQVSGLLETYYNEDAECYREGYTDAKIGEEIGVSEQFVTRFRTEAFGPLKCPNELSTLVKDIEDMEGFLDDLKTRVMAAVSKFG